MADPDQVSTLTRPPEKLVRSFKLWQVKDHTIRFYLEQGYSLGICCQDCPRVTEWTPYELEQRFGSKLETRIERIVPRLACTGEGGCGSHNVAVFPHLYDGQRSRPSTEDHSSD